MKDEAKIVMKWIDSKHGGREYRLVRYLKGGDASPGELIEARNSTDALGGDRWDPVPIPCETSATMRSLMKAVADAGIVANEHPDASYDDLRESYKAERAANLELSRRLDAARKALDGDG